MSKRLNDKNIKERISDIVHIDDYRLDIKLSDCIFRAFLDKHIYFGRADRRISEHSILTMPRYAAIEPYSCFADGSTLCAMGAFSYSESPLPTDLSLGRYCSIALGLDIFRYPPNGRLPAPVIEHDVWIGQHVQLARGIRIGTGAVIGAGAVVTKDVAPYAIVGGVPAKTIRFRFPDNVIDQLLRLKWWQYDPSILKAADYRDIRRFIDDMNSIENKTPYSPPVIYADDILYHVMNSA